MNLRIDAVIFTYAMLSAIVQLNEQYGGGGYSQATLCERLNCSRRNITYAQQRAVSAGYLVVENGSGHRPNLYHVQHEQIPDRWSSLFVGLSSEKAAS